MAKSKDEQWEDQRSAMYNAWKRQNDIKEANCQHRWGAATPVSCLECGKVKPLLP